MTPAAAAAAKPTDPPADELTAKQIIAEQERAEQILAELRELDPQIIDAEARVRDLRVRRLELYLEGRALHPPQRIIYIALGEASGRSEALVIKQVAKAEVARAAGKGLDTVVGSG